MPGLRCTIVAGLIVVVASALAGCSVNPATGQRQLMLYGEEDEVALGRQGDPEAVRRFGRYPDEALQTYVQGLGRSLASVSERPDLPWTFRLLDDPLVNAFAAPGGFIYVTRGILSHMSSEAELAGVIGHEIGHVTARHSMNQMSKASLGQLGMVVGMVAAPEAAGAIGQLGGAGLQVLFLKYGRDDERQADTLGLRYLRRAGYAAGEFPEVFEILGRVSAAEGATPIPNWLSTHPAPENRTERLLAEIRQLEATEGEAARAGKVERDAYLLRLAGMTYGHDPREGFFRAEHFYHPTLAFELVLPREWQRQNTRQSVFGVSPEQDAIVALTLEQSASASEAARVFFAQSGILRGPAWQNELNGRRAVSYGFEVPRTTGSNLVGVAAFVEHRGQIFRLLGYTLDTVWEQRRPTLLQSVGSFREVTDRRILGVEPRRIQLLRLARTGPLAEQPELARADLAELELLNNLEPGETLAAGTLIKTVVGEKLDAAGSARATN